jgi:hypothetical protein
MALFCLTCDKQWLIWYVQPQLLPVFFQLLLLNDGIGMKGRCFLSLLQTMVAVNVMGGTMAKMISPQSIAVAAAAVGLVGKENELFKFTIKYSLIFLVCIGVISWLIL